MKVYLLLTTLFIFTILLGCSSNGDKAADDSSALNGEGTVLEDSSGQDKQEVPSSQNTGEEISDPEEFVAQDMEDEEMYRLDPEVEMQMKEYIWNERYAHYLDENWVNPHPDSISLMALKVRNGELNVNNCWGVDAYYGTYNGVVVVESPSTLTVGISLTIEGITISANHPGIWFWKDGRFHDPRDLHAQGLLTKDVMLQIAERQKNPLSGQYRFR